jgi:hypothetical protein
VDQTVYELAVLLVSTMTIASTATAFTFTSHYSFPSLTRQARGQHRSLRF